MQQATTSFRGQAVLVADSLYHHTARENRPYPSIVTFKMPDDGILSTKLHDTSGKLMYQRNFGLTKAGNYAIGFANIDTTGMYFISISFGDTRTTRMIMLRPDSQPSFVHIPCPAKAMSRIDGRWQFSYSQEYTPPIQPQTESHKIKYIIEHFVQMNLDIGSYEIIWQSKINGKTEKKLFNGCYEVIVDTLRLYKDQSSHPWHEFKYSYSDNNLTLTYVPKIVNKSTGPIMTFPLSQDPTGMFPTLMGKYERVINRSK